MIESPSGPDGVEVNGSERRLTYRAREVTLDDGTVIAHESQGGSMSSVWFTDLGGCYVEVVHLGDGPTGGELVLVVPDLDLVAIGDLYAADPAGATGGWAAAVDLALGLTTSSTSISSSIGPVTRDELEAFHQRLLAVLHG